MEYSVEIKKENPLLKSLIILILLYAHLANTIVS